jgi:hypothetical protein
MIAPFSNNTKNGKVFNDALKFVSYNEMVKLRNAV